MHILHITDGDCAAALLKKSGLAGEVLAWQDILYDGPRRPGWPTQQSLQDRALFLESVTGGGKAFQAILDGLLSQYQKLAAAGEYERVVFWFDACLFDQSMLVHLLSCLHEKQMHHAELVCIDAFPGIEPFNGLGQLQPEDFFALYEQRCEVSPEEFDYAMVVDSALVDRDFSRLEELASVAGAPLPFVPAALSRFLQERPDPVTGLGLLESLALTAIRCGYEKPWDIFGEVALKDRSPQFWGDTTLWAKINGLAGRKPPLVLIQGPGKLLPQWPGPDVKLDEFRVKPLPCPSGPLAW